MIGVSFKKDPVFWISGALAILSSLVFPASSGILASIDFDTLILLFALMLSMEGLKRKNVFRLTGQTLLKRVRTQRGVVLTLTALCFFSSMFITNDVALITFIPLGLLVFDLANLEKHLCFGVTVMTIAANLGSMLTPVGNPQNLYLYALSGQSLPQFLLLMLPYSLLAAVMLGGCIFLMCKNAPVSFTLDSAENVSFRSICPYLLLFLLALLCVAGVFPKWILFPAALVLIFFADRSLFLKADYSLLATFVFFFVFIGNVKGLSELCRVIESLLAGRECLAGVLLSQVISNVPAAILLSGYTRQFSALIVGTNLGGLGTLIASMASLISYKLLAASHPEQKGRYLGVFTAWNLAFLVVLCALAWVLL